MTEILKTLTQLRVERKSKLAEEKDKDESVVSNDNEDNSDLIGLNDEEEISSSSLKNTSCNLGNHIIKEENAKALDGEDIIPSLANDESRYVAVELNENFVEEKGSKQLIELKNLSNLPLFCTKCRVFSHAHKVFDESPESKWVVKSDYANTYEDYFTCYAHKPPKPPDYTNHNYTNHSSQKNSCIANITKLTSHTPISRFTKTDIDATYVVTELNRFQMVAGLFDITSNLQLEVGECATECSSELLKKKNGNHFSMTISNGFKPILLMNLRLFRSKMMMHEFLTQTYSIKQKSGANTKIVLISGTEGDIVPLIRDDDEFWLDGFGIVFEYSMDTSTRESLVRLWVSIYILVNSQVKATPMLYNVASTKFVYELEGNYMKVVCESIKSEEVDIKNVVFQMFASLSSTYYELLEVCIQTLLELPTTIKGDENAIKNFSIVPDEEMEVYKSESRNSYPYSCLTVKSLSLWVSLLLKTLPEKDDDHEGGVVNLTMAGETCIVLATRLLVGGVKVALVNPYGQNKILKVNWRSREVAARASLESQTVKKLSTMVLSMLNFTIDKELCLHYCETSCQFVGAYELRRHTKRVRSLDFSIPMVNGEPLNLILVSSYKDKGIYVGKWRFGDLIGNPDKMKAQNSLAYNIKRHVLVNGSHSYCIYLEHLVMGLKDRVFLVGWQQPFLLMGHKSCYQFPSILYIFMDKTIMGCPEIARPQVDDLGINHLTIIQEKVNQRFVSVVEKEVTTVFKASLSFLKTLRCCLLKPNDLVLNDSGSLNY